MVIVPCLEYVSVVSNDKVVPEVIRKSLIKVVVDEHLIDSSVWLPSVAILAKRISEVKGAETLLEDPMFADNWLKHLIQMGPGMP